MFDSWNIEDLPNLGHFCDENIDDYLMDLEMEISGMTKPPIEDFLIDFEMEMPGMTRPPAAHAKEAGSHVEQNPSQDKSDSVAPVKNPDPTDILECVGKDRGGARGTSKPRIRRRTACRATNATAVTRVLTNDKSGVKVGGKWRNTGRKQTKGNPYPRKYFQCNLVKKSNCPARRWIQACADNKKLYTIQYTDAHDHSVPT